MIQAFVNIPCNGQCYRRQTGRSLRAKMTNGQNTRKSRLSFSSHSLVVLCLLLCSCCDLCLLIVLMGGLCSNFFRCWPSAKGASFACLSEAIQAECTRTGDALKSAASDALKTGFEDDEAKPLRAICLHQWRQKGQKTVKTSVKCYGGKLCALKGIYALYLSQIKAEIVLNLLSWPMQVAE